MIFTRTPLRISLVGGGTDVPAFYEKTGGCVVSFTINKHVYVAVNPKFDGRYRVSYSQTENVDSVKDIRHNLVRETLLSYGGDRIDGLEVVSVSDIPGEGSGLGSSSSFTVGLVNALQAHIGTPISNLTAKEEFANFAFGIERRSNTSIGKQDHYAAAFGGLNVILFDRNGVTVQPISWLDDMNTHFLLLWTGITRAANEILSMQENRLRNVPLSRVAGEEMADIAKNMAEHLMNGDTKEVGYFLHENWRRKRMMNPNTTSSHIDELYDKAMSNGAEGGKLCGAGGGGFLLFWAPPHTHERIVEATGLRKIDFEFEPEGSKVIYNGN